MSHFSPNERSLPNEHRISPLMKPFIRGRISPLMKGLARTERRVSALMNGLRLMNTDNEHRIPPYSKLWLASYLAS